MAAQNFPIIFYDLPTVSRFFRSVALAIATQRHTHSQWVTYKDSKVLNAVYSVMFWKEPPGTVEVKQADVKVLNAATDKLHQEFLLAWIEKVHTGGPIAGNAYVAQMASLREYARKAVQDLFREIGQINNEIAGRTGEAIEDLAKIRLAAAVGVAVIGGVAGVAFAAGGAAAGAGLTVFGVQAGAGAMTFGGAGLAYSVTNSLVKTWEQGPSAKVAAIATDGGKFVASEGLGRIAEKTAVKAVEQSSRSDAIIKSAEGLIAQHSKRLAEQKLKKKAMQKSTDIIARSTAQAARVWPTPSPTAW